MAIILPSIEILMKYNGISMAIIFATHEKWFNRNLKWDKQLNINKILMDWFQTTTFGKCRY